MANDYGVSISNTPWGHVQHSKEIAEGIVFVSTASHGGIVLSEPRMAEFDCVFFGFESYAGYGYFEEDQDWAVIALAFPDLFSPEDVYNAVATARSSATPWESIPDAHVRWLNVVARLDDPDNKASAIATRFHLEHLNCYQVGSAGTSGKGWHVSLRRVKDSAQAWAQFAEYPTKSFYSVAELAALDTRLA